MKLINFEEKDKIDCLRFEEFLKLLDSGDFKAVAVVGLHKGGKIVTDAAGSLVTLLGLVQCLQYDINKMAEEL